MANRENLSIDVNINPNEQPNSAATNIQPKPNVANNTTNLRKIAAIGLVANAGRQIGMSTLGQVGAITGNSQLQRKINRVTTLGGIAASFAVNPLVGTLTLATTLGSEAISTALKVRNENNSADYYNKVRGRRIDKGRIK